MADSNIGALPQAPQLDDDSLLVAEQQGQAVKVTGAQFKEFGRQAVVGQVQSYVDAAEAAASCAVDAVSAVTDMTVEARTLDNGQPATVTKSTRNGKVNLAFGLPRGAQGVPGPEGPAGPRGVRGETGRGLTILGYYDTPQALENAAAAPEAGDAYGVGTEAPYDIYVFDGAAHTWKNSGPLSGGGGVIPENVVTSEGGASLEIPDAFGDTPHVIRFTDEEEPPLTAGDIAYGSSSVDDALEQLFTSVGDGKARIASAITDKGVPTAQDASFADMAEHIGQITGGADASDTTATPFDILAGKTAYTAAGKVEGTIPSLPAKTYTPGTAAQVIASGQYLGGNQTISGDPNLTSGNIKKGVSIFGVAGAVEQNFLATLTVTADVGAVVTATHTSGGEVEALSTTGTVILELPLEGQWTVTARRGIAQYNSVVVNVSSQYSAALTAEVHIVRYGVCTPLSGVKWCLAAAANESYVLFGGGLGAGNGTKSYATVDFYDKFLAHGTSESLSAERYNLSAATVGEYVLFAGGYEDTYRREPWANVDAYNKTLVKSTPDPLSIARHHMGEAQIGNYVLFCGGCTKSSSVEVATIDAYDISLARTEPDPLALISTPIGASNENYALFCGSGKATAYNTRLTRTLATNPSKSFSVAARAGNYIVFAGGIGDDGSIVEAYDLFLTKVTAEPLSIGRYNLAAVSLHDYAIFGGGSQSSGGKASSTVDAFDIFLTRTCPENFEGPGRSFLAAALIGDYALFGGGRGDNSVNCNTVEAYQYV